MPKECQCQWSFKDVLSRFQRGFMGAKVEKIVRCFKDVFKVYQGSVKFFFYKRVSRKFQGYFKKDLLMF